MKKYRKKFDYSYALGVFPTIELLKYRPNQVMTIFLSSKGTRNAGINKIKELSAKHRIKIEVNDQLIARLSNAGDIYAAGIFRKYLTTLAKNNNHLLMVNPRDMGNLGTIIRTMAGFGLSNLGIVRPAVDIFDPKVIRASMGAIFQINYCYFNQFEEYRKLFPNNVYPVMTDGKISLRGANFEEPYVLVFGNEGAGLGKEYHGIGTSIRIPQEKTIDSLNLSIAVGITLYQASKTKV